jgi:hypothetical protein
VIYTGWIAGADPGFQVREGAHLKKLRRAEGGTNIFGVFRVKNHDFTPKKSYFSNFRGGGGAPGAPWIRPWMVSWRFCESKAFPHQTDFFLFNQMPGHSLNYGCDHMCNQCLKLWVWTPFMARCTRCTLCDKVCQLLATGRWFSPGTPASSTNKTDHNDITEILLKVALNTTTPNQRHCYKIFKYTLNVKHIILQIIRTTIQRSSNILSNKVKVYTH